MSEAATVRQWSPYQSAIFDAIRETRDSLLVEAVAGCLSGSTVIDVNRGGKSYPETIEHLTYMMNGGVSSGRIYDPRLVTQIRSKAPRNDLICLSPTIRAIASGRKETWLVATYSRNKLRATPDHQMLTPDGWKKLGDLKVGDSLIVDLGRGGRAKEGKNNYTNIYRMDNHPFRSVTHNRGVAYYRVPEHRVIMEAAINGVEFEIFVEEIRAGNIEGYTFLDPDNTHVHHRDENPLNNVLDNLVCMTPKEHFNHHETWKNGQANVGPSVITYLQPFGEEETFDLTMAQGVSPNFLANGIVVHNSGKTTTIVEAINWVPDGQSVCFLAFNKSIAEELKRRITRPGARCATLHSIGNAAWREYLSWDSANCRMDSRKTFNIAQDLDRRLGQTGKLIAIAKGAGIVPSELNGYRGLMEDKDENWDELIDFYGLDPDETSIALARRVLVESIKRSKDVIDFDDMLYMPIISGAPFAKSDVVFVDELQDLNGIQHEIVARMATRVIGVGDRHQSIYGFRGALADSMDQFGKRFDCKSLPLSVSYRCPKNVVKHVQRLVSHIETFDGAQDGLVEYCAAWKLADFRPEDAILCRVNRPLVALAFALIRARIACKILGRDIGQGLVAIVKKQKADSIEDLIKKLAAWRTREVMRAHGEESKIARVEDQYATLREFMFSEGEDSSVDALIRSIESLFSDNGENRSMVTLSTVHKAKGLEWPRVFILDAEEHMPSKWARKPWELQAEVNIQYVAETRAKGELRYVTSEGMGSV